MIPSRARFERRYHTGLPRELRGIQEQVELRAKEAGLDFFPIHYELVTTEEMAMLAAQGGFPRRYPHWRFGMEYDQLHKSHKYGLSKIYEMVINTDPCVAYLVDTNTLMDHKLVMAHVCAHCDFFKHNLSFAPTDRGMIDRTANHAARVQRHIETVGFERVESFLDAALSLENLIDVHALGNPRALPKAPDHKPPAAQQAFLAAAPWDEERTPTDPTEGAEDLPKVPERPERDVLGFLIQHAPLTEWQQDLISIVRAEAQYFSPQGRTKIMNEGWATLWHTRLMTGSLESGAGLLTDSEVVDYADHHAGTVFMAPGSFNPYRVGVMLFRHIWDRWDRGQFGAAWDECDTMERRANWNLETGLGRDKVFQIRRVHTDLSFIDAYLDEDFCREAGLFAMGRERRTGRWVVRSRDVADVRKYLLTALENGGQPIIEVEDSNHDNRGELMLVHRHSGRDLEKAYVESTLGNLARIWRRPALVRTILDDKTVVYRHDGQECGMQKAE
jgi:stage V sporulation protein R